MSRDDLLKRLREATGADREIDALLWSIAKGGQPYEEGTLVMEKAPDGRTWPLGFLDRGVSLRNFTIYNNNTPSFTAFLDAAIGLVERMLPDTDDKRYHGVVWFGRNPAARILYDSRDTEAEGGWSIGALNQHEVHAPTPALALLIALLEALNAQEQAKP